MSRYGPIAISGGDTGAPLNLQKRLQLISPFLCAGGTRLLDCGCGSGDYLRRLRVGFDVDAFGMEYGFDKVQAAHHKTRRACQADLQAIPFADQTFDAALLNEVLEHVPDESRVLAEIRRILRPGGRLFLFSPNRWYPFETHGVTLKVSGKRLPAHVPLVPYVPLAVGRHIFHYVARNYWHRELCELVSAAGFRIESRGYVWQTFENISGAQPRWIRWTRPALQAVAGVLEHTPFLKAFGVSQMLVAQKR